MSIENHLISSLNHCKLHHISNDFYFLIPRSQLFEFQSNCFEFVVTTPPSPVVIVLRG